MVAADGNPLRVIWVGDLVLKEQVVWADGLTVDDIVISIIVAVDGGGAGDQKPLKSGVNLVLDVFAGPVVAQCDLGTLRLDDVIIGRGCRDNRDGRVTQRKPGHDVSVDIEQQVDRLALTAVRPGALVD